MTIIFKVLCFGLALVAVSEGQDMTSMMFQAMGMDPPPMPPVMPQSLREHLYPGQQEILRQAQQQQQLKQRYMAYLAAHQLRQAKENPYSAPYSTSVRKQPRANSVYSPANMIRQPGTANSVSSAKTGNTGNPYSVSRAASSGNTQVRNSARARMQIPPQAVPMMKTMQAMRAMKDQPKRITDAKAAGCKLPVESPAASMFLFSSCRSPAARMVCQAEMMTCMTVGVTPMCCPYGMNRLAMDTINYANKMQQFIADLM